MDAGDAQLGFVQSDVMSYAYNGTNLFDGAKVDNASLPLQHFLHGAGTDRYPPDPEIKSVA